MYSLQAADIPEKSQPCSYQNITCVRFQNLKTSITCKEAMLTVIDHRFDSFQYAFVALTHTHFFNATPFRAADVHVINYLGRGYLICTLFYT